MTVRMGFHRHTGKRDDMFKAYVDRVRPQFVKFLDGFPQDLADYCHARGTRIIGRVYFQTQKLGAEGSRQMQQVVQTAREKPWIDYWELHNEDWQHGAEMERYAELCIEFMGELDRIGKKAAIGCFSTGQPEVKEWVRFLPALKYAAAHNHAWSVHEYGGGPPGAKWGVGRNQWNNGQPVTDDPCTDPNMRYLGWWCLRYRRAVDEMKRLGMVKIPDLLITEALIDDIQPRPGNVGKGYKDFRGQHPANVGDYADQWAWYCRELSKDPYVIGAVDFGWATADPTWNSFDVSTDPVTFDRLIQTMTALPNTTPAPPTPQPQPTPPETPPMNNVEAIIWAEVDKAHKLRGLPYTPSHALVAAAKIPAGVMLPTTDEITVTSAGGRYVAQRFQRSDTGAVIVLYCREGVWNKIYRIAPESGGGADVPPAAGPAFAWPIGSTAAARALPSIPPGWYTSVGFDQEYTVNGRAAVHPGLDLSDVRGGDTDLGAPVYAMAGGVVVASTYSADSWGNIVMVRHDNVPGYGTLWTQYAHLQARAVAVGDVVKQGQTVGTIGKGAGDRFAAHLHLEVRRMDLPATAWPGNSHGKVIAGYIDPRSIIGGVG